MKLHIKLFCTFTILCSILSCSQEKVTAIQPAEASMSTIGTDSIIEWSKAESVSSESLINTEMDSVAIIPLKENEGHMLGQISYISCHDDTLVVADNHQVCLYDAKGKYIIAIGAVGHGPEEYLDFGGVFASHDSIYIKDKGAGQILTYDYCGRNTNKRKFKDGAPQDFFVLKNGSILGAYSGYRQNSLYRLIVFN